MIRISSIEKYLLIFPETCDKLLFERRESKKKKEEREKEKHLFIKIAKSIKLNRKFAKFLTSGRYFCYLNRVKTESRRNFFRITSHHITSRHII